MKFSIVTTLYLSEKYIEDFYKRISETVSKVSKDFEIIFVNDGSPDDSIEVVKKLHNLDGKVKIIDFSKNFGHHKAIMTGLSYAKGDYVFLIDSDLEEEPECFERFWNEISQNPSLDMVYGVQKTRKGGAFEKISGSIWYKFMNLMTNNSIPENFLTVRIMTQNFVKNLVTFKEHELNFSTLINLNGFKSKKLYIEKLDKKSSSYNLIRKLNITFNTITSSTAMPLWLVFYLGLFITFLAGLFIVYLLYVKIFTDVDTEGWTSLMTMMLFLGGLNIFMIGIIGIYTSKIFVEVKKRPYTIIKEVFDKTN
jgi:putative glycosyltransferase